MMDFISLFEGGSVRARLGDGCSVSGGCAASGGCSASPVRSIALSAEAIDGRLSAAARFSVRADAVSGRARDRVCGRKDFDDLCA